MTMYSNNILYIVYILYNLLFPRYYDLFFNYYYSQITRYALEPLLHEYSVDMFMAGHEHSYERFYPVYNYTIGKGSEEAPYNNPR